MAPEARVTHDTESDCAYVQLAPVVEDGQAVEQVVVDRPGLGEVVLDFDAAGRLLGVEVVGAEALLGAATLGATFGTAPGAGPRGVGARD